MKKTVQKIIAILLVITLALTIENPITLVSAAEIIDSGKCGNNVIWKFYDDGTLEIQGAGDMYDYDDYPSGAPSDDVSPWGPYHYEIERIKIQEGVTSIGAWAFATCEVLRSVEIPDSVCRINEYSFIHCRQLREINLSDNIEYIGEAAFLNTRLKGLTLPQKIKVIERYSFQNSDLETVTINGDIDLIGERAFSGCIYLKEVKFGGIVNEIGEAAFDYCHKLQRLSNIKQIKRIDQYAFYECLNLSGIDMFHGLEYIGESAFAGAFAYETKLVIPDTVKQIEKGAFSSGYYHSELIVPDTVESIGRFLGGNYKITWKISNDAVVKQESIIEGERVLFDYNDATYISTTKSVTIKNESESPIRVDGELVAVGETYVSKPIEERPTVEETTSQKETTMEETTAEETVTEDSDVITGTVGGNGNTWRYDKTTGTLEINSEYSYVTLYEEDLQSISNEVRHIVLKEGIRGLSSDYREGLLFPRLETITFPATMERVDEEIFNPLQRLCEFIVDADNPVYETVDGVLYNKKEKQLIRFPAGKKDSIYSIKDGTKSIGKYAFYNTRNIKEIIAPESVSAIYLNFAYLVNIEKITLYNPNCVIDKTYVAYKDLVISSYENSQVEEKCKSLGINFEKLEIVNRVENITVTSKPEQTTFVLGREPNLAGLKIRVTYEDGTVANTDSGYTVSKADVNQLGEQKINIYFGNGETYITVNYVEMKEDEQIDINTRRMFYLNSIFPYKEYYFTPVNSGIYNIYTLGVGEVFYNNGVIMDMNNKVIRKQIGDYNYNVNVELTAGETYIIRTDINDKDDDARIALYVKLKELKGECHHNFNQYVKTVGATCTSKGYTLYRCEYCNEEIKTNYTDITEHDYEIIKTIPPTCTQDGYIVCRCTDCGYKMGIADKEHPALGHDYVDTVVAPTITEYGYTLHECSNCNYSYKSDWVKPLGFDKNETTTNNEVTTKEEPTTRVEPTTKAEIKTTEKASVTKINSLAKPRVKAKRIKRKIKLTLTSTNKKIKYQIYIKKKGKYKLVKTTAKKSYILKKKAKCYIRVRCVRYEDKKIIYSKYKKLTVKKYKK